MRIAKVPAARALREIAAERGEMTDLRRGEAQVRQPQCRDRRPRCAASAAIAAIVVSAPMVAAPSAPHVDADRVGRRGEIDQRSLAKRRCAAVRKGRCRRRGIRRVERKPSSMRMSCCGPPFQCGNQAVGPDRNFGQPDAGGVANGIGERRRGRHRRHLADPDAAAEHVIETAFVEMHDRSRACRRCRECGNPPSRRRACRRCADRFRALRRAHSRGPGSPSPSPGCAPARARRSCRRRCRYGR